MASRKRTRVLQNICKQIPATTPVLQNNTKDRSILVDKTNQIFTVRALRSRKIYHDQNTDTFVTVSKKLFKNGVAQSPRALSKKQSSTQKHTVHQKCSAVVEKVDKTNNQRDMVCKDRNSSSAEKQTLTKKLGKVLGKGSKCPVVPEKVGEAKVNKDISSPNADKQITTKRLRNIPQISTKRNVEAKDQKKLVYKDISPPSAEKQKTFTPEKKIMLYDFKGGSGSSNNLSGKPAQKRKPVRKRIKCQSDTSDEENCNVQNVTKKMKMLAACSQENQKDSTNLQSQTLQSSMNSSVQPLRDQNTSSNQLVKSETRKFFKTPMRKELVEMSLFNYTNQKKKKFSKSRKPLSTKKENSKNYRKKQNLIFCKSTQNNFDTSKKLPLKPVMLNENNAQSKLGNVATLGNSKIPLLVKPTTSNTKIPVLVKPISNSSKIPVSLKSVISSTVDPQAAITDKTEMMNCVEIMMDVDVCTVKDLSTEKTATKETLTALRINYKRGGTNFGLDFTLGESETDCSKQTDKCAVQTTLPAHSIIPATAAPPVPVAKQMQVVKDKTESRNYFNGPVRSFQFLERYARNTRRHRVDALYIPAAPSTEHFTFENYFGFDEVPENELTLSPVKQQCVTNITAPPLTSTPHITTVKSILPQPNRLIVKPELKEYQHKANGSIPTSQNNCSQILARGGCRYKNKSSALTITKTATFALPQLRNIPASTAKNKQSGISMVQSSITDYMQSDREMTFMSDVPFDTSLSNIEAEELSITHTKHPRRSYERPIRNRRRINDDDNVSETEEENPQTNTLSRNHSRSKRRPKRSKKQERMFEKWASNVSSQFEEIDSVALIVE